MYFWGSLILSAKIYWNTISLNFQQNNIENNFNEIKLYLNRAKGNLNPENWTYVINVDSNNCIEIIDTLNEILTSIENVKNLVLTNQQPNIENINEITENIEEQYDSVINILSMIEETDPDTF